jgi:DNA mismatch repair protein MutS
MCSERTRLTAHDQNPALLSGPAFSNVQNRIESTLPAMSNPNPTPMIQQYLGIKAKHKDAILFYRMGDFYEMFFEDAEVASRVLEITLTSRNKNEPTPVPMCGVPYRAAQSYIARLIDNGFKVAVCDQVEDPSTAKGLVKREVVRVITPGMIVEGEWLDAKSNNFLLSLSFHRKRFGLACMDISTGLFRVAENPALDQIMDEVQRIGPRELVMPHAFRGSDLVHKIEAGFPGCAVNWLEDAAFDPQRGRRVLIEHFRTLTLEGFGCHDLEAGLGAAGALLQYVEETQKQALAHCHNLSTYTLDDHLIIDSQSRQNLELEKNLRTGTRQGTLIGILDKTATAMGGRCLRQWLRYPLRSAERIGRRLDAVEEALGRRDIRQAVREALQEVYDLERLNGKIAMGHANARDLTALKKSLQMLPPIWEALAQLQSDLFEARPDLQKLTELAGVIEAAIREDAPPITSEGGMVKEGYQAALDELIRLSRDGKGYLARLEGREKEASGISSLKVRFNKVFGYYIEVPKTQSGLVPAHYVRKQTLVNAERYITDELKQFENKVLGAEEQRNRIELEIFTAIREQIVGHSESIQAVAGFLARLDCLMALAEVADQNDHNRPAINSHGLLHIVEARHPVVEKMISAERFVPNTLTLDNETQQILIITGPNMAGKSTILRQTALIVILAQMGAFVPAIQADIAITDRIFTRVGALDNLAAGQSTFMVEMQETANILNNATPRSLVIMDEIGRGTSTYDGLSIAWAVVEYLHQLSAKGVKTLFATHYHELTELALNHPRIKNFHIAVKEWNDQVIFLRKLTQGGTNRSYGIQVARLAGIPEQVIQAAKKILIRIESQAPARRGHDGKENGAIEAPVQMELFRPVEQELLERLRKIDINHITPMEAMQLLAQLQAKARSVS